VRQGSRGSVLTARQTPARAAPCFPARSTFVRLSTTKADHRLNGLMHRLRNCFRHALTGRVAHVRRVSAAQQFSQAFSVFLAHLADGPGPTRFVLTLLHRSKPALVPWRANGVILPSKPAAFGTGQTNRIEGGLSLLDVKGRRSLRQSPHHQSPHHQSPISIAKPERPRDGQRCHRSAGRGGPRRAGRSRVCQQARALPAGALVTPASGGEEKPRRLAGAEAC
jgi:hypothetical protein